LKPGHSALFGPALAPTARSMDHAAQDWQRDVSRDR
jgi:hypothetical protein